MIVLGINAYHGDSSACIIVDGKMVAAVEEERFTRIKHWAGMPENSIKYCLSVANISISAVDHIAINSNPRSNLMRKISYTVKKRPSITHVVSRLLNTKKRTGVNDVLKNIFSKEKIRAEIHYVDHHESHLSSAYYLSPFDKAIVLSVDGFGDFESTAWAIGSDCNLKKNGAVYFPHSLGIFYQALTQYLGFMSYGDEYKVMGLAPYGSPSFVNEMEKIVKSKGNGLFELGLEYFRHYRENIGYQWTGGVPLVDRLYSPELERLLGPARKAQDELTQRHKDIAHSVQKAYENALFNLINTLQLKTGIKKLELAGGCGMNSVANGKIYQHTKIENVYVQAAAGDAGGALGAAYAVYHKNKRVRRFGMTHAYWGPEFSDDAIEQEIAKRAELTQKEFSVTRYRETDPLTKHIATHIANSKVVGWFQGRMEWGPRALGNRSILGDPRNANMKDILNLKIKRRESFRPFAPSVLRGAVSDWFETDDDVPFMMKVFKIRENKRDEIPAVCHVDGTGRLQTVTEEGNKRFYQLISAFQAITGVPMVLNTSFNENEPIVCTPGEALDCFLRTSMDVLVMNNTVIERVSRD